VPCLIGDRVFARKAAEPVAEILGESAQFLTGYPASTNIQAATQVQPERIVGGGVAPVPRDVYASRSVARFDGL
jgi:hypothetical protein